jgi:hypothetical protein
MRRHERRCPAKFQSYNIARSLILSRLIRSRCKERAAVADVLENCRLAIQELQDCANQGDFDGDIQDLAELLGEYDINNS